MAFDTLLRRLYLPVMVALLGLSAYLQASALTEFFGASYLQPDEAELTKVVQGGVRPKVSERPVLRSADMIIHRNPFDSVTGPLDAQPLEVPDEQQQEADLSDPLQAVSCEGMMLNIVTESPDPVWSVAQIKAPNDTQAMMRRVGDLIGDFEVAFIGYNPVKASPSVWMLNKGNLCQVLLFEPAEAAKTPAPPPVAPTPPASAVRSGTDRGSQVPPEIADKIKRNSDTDYEIERAVVDNILENQAQLMRSARIVPEQKDGKVVGIRLFGIRPDTLLGALGLQNGDRLEQINGFDMASPEKALEAYARLRTASKLTVKVTRRGQPMTIDYNIR